MKALDEHLSNGGVHIVADHTEFKLSFSTEKHRSERLKVIFPRRDCGSVVNY